MPKLEKLSKEERNRIADFVELGWFVVVTAGVAITEGDFGEEEIIKQAGRVRDVVDRYLKEVE